MQESARRYFCFLPAHGADVPMSALILRCSNHHLFHFGRGERERDGEVRSRGRELKPQAFFFESMRNSGSCTSSSFSLTQWRDRKRMKSVRIRRWKWHVLNVISEWNVISRSKSSSYLLIDTTWILFNPIHTGTTLYGPYGYALRLCHCGFFQPLVFQPWTWKRLTRTSSTILGKHTPSS